jgi:uncharacterized membrane protein
MTQEKKLYKEGPDEFPVSKVVQGNLLMVIWILLGGIGCWLFYPLAAWIYLPVAVVMVYVVLRRLVCTNCDYYGKRCALGWGKLSALLFKQGSIELFAGSIGVKLAPVTYGLLSFVPLVFIIISLTQGFATAKVVVLVLLLLISVYSGGISRKKGCAECRMKLICPGAAAK